MWREALSSLLSNFFTRWVNRGSPRYGLGFLMERAELASDKYSVGEGEGDLRRLALTGDLERRPGEPERAPRLGEPERAPRLGGPGRPPRLGDGWSSMSLRDGMD